MIFQHAARGSNRRFAWGWKSLIYLVLTAATILAYSSVRTHEFLIYDDPLYVTDNHAVQSGLSWQNVVWAFTTTDASNWHPVTWLSHMLDCELFGLNPGAHHMVNLFFHVVNTLLLLFVLEGMTGAFWQSAFAATLFALHPLHVESVAWVAERKDLASMLFWLLTIWAYVRYSRLPVFRRYLLVVVFFILGLMAKPMVVTLPFVLLLLDYWPLRRFGFQGSSNDTFSPWFLIKEKIPLFVLSAASSLATYYAQQGGDAVKSLASIALKVRLANAVDSYVAYLGKTVWPLNLSVFYPHPGKVLVWQTVIAFVLLLCISSAVFVVRKHRPYLVVGWLWYLGALVPVIGVVQVGLQSMADRYTYIPLTGVFIAMTWGASDLVQGWRHRRLVLALSALAVVGSLVICTSRQMDYWRDSISLFRHALDVTKDNYMAHLNLGVALQMEGQVDGAIVQLEKALECKPHYTELPRAHYNLGLAMAKQNKLDKALSHLRRAVEIDPEWASAHNDLGIVLARQADLDQAIYHFSEALRLRPDLSRAKHNLRKALGLRNKRH